MTEALSGLLAALWLGVLTSISPCPLATNIAAISYVGSRVGNSRRVLLAGLLYTAGRALVYLALSVVLVSSLLAAPALSHALQKYGHKLLGPILILVGMVLLDLIRLRPSGISAGGGVSERLAKAGVWGALPLGALFALSFCPTSAALFFGSLLPLAVERHSPVALPISYGVGTALPVVLFAVLLAAGAQSVGRVFERVSRLEIWARRATGVVFIAIGVYFVLAYVFEVL
jgi:cytochrome c biogenesis protein CcdA